MPKIDQSSVPVRRRLVYPEPFFAETEGYEGQRFGDAAGLMWLLVRPREPDLAARLACSIGFSSSPDRSWLDWGGSWLDFGPS